MYYRLTCQGNTRDVKDTLKARHWKYDASAQNWHKQITAADRAKIIGGDKEFLKTFGGCLKGCRLVIESTIVWASATYAERPQAAANGKAPDQDGMGWNCDAAGNRVATQRIPGSAPDDMI